jgi:hypothetical protein
MPGYYKTCTQNDAVLVGGAAGLEEKVERRS